MWSCCGKKVSSDSCTGSEFHIPHQYPQGEIERLWRFFSTPIISNNSNIRLAVALDCEMGTATSGDSELIRVTLVDYFSSAILVDSLVYPDVEMSHYNTRFSGVTKRDMKIARAKGTCFRGRDEARLAVWQFVGPNTIVVGHSVNCDLTAMRWIHPIVVDTLLIESMKAKAAQEKEAKAIAEPIDPAIITDMTSNVAQEALKKGRKGPGTLSLKTLAMVRLNREIQSNGNKGHDSLEDALAARDLAHWHVMNSDYGGKDSPGIQVVNRRV
jgi:RNA exonuclease 1